MVGLLVRNWHSDVRQIMFADPKFQPIYLMCTALTVLLSTFGLVLGWNSAGQRRNDLQRRSWLGFFLGTGVLALAIVFLVAFWMLKLQAPA